MALSTLLGFLSAAIVELALFAAIGFLCLGIDDVFVDILWFLSPKKSRLISEIAPPAFPGKFAIFVAAWQESNVISNMLKEALRGWQGQNFVIYVGCYPNDIPTISAARSIADPHIRVVVGDQMGPTTKGDCLNTLWRALVADEAQMQSRYKAIILHDAEDFVHPEELNIFDSCIEQFAVVQIPVLPEVDAASRWISGHYIDEFAEAHTRDMVVRQGIGASLPMAGVGCAIRRDAIARATNVRGGAPFNSNSLTEDYELGLLIGELGFPSAFVRIYDEQRHALVAVRAHFPGEFETAIRQKTRWSIGIALLGWQKLGWRGGLAERWMRLRDRRTVLSAIIIATGYLALILTLLLDLVSISLGQPAVVFSSFLTQLWMINLALLLWRAIIRAICVNRQYGAAEALRSIPRMVTSSFIALASARRAVFLYLRHLRTDQLVWDKTVHKFPNGGKS
jgi:bacteriophage N4 adsorption protein B